MQDFGTKADDTAGPSGQLSAAEFNNLATELENSVLRSGQALISGSTTQLATSLFLHGVKSESFQDSGLADAYVVTPVSGAAGVLLPADYANLDGAVITFQASNTNTGASTLNFGQTTGTLLGTKAIRTQADVAIPANAIASGQTVQLKYNSAFNAGAGAWILLPWAFSALGAHGIAVFTANGTWTVPAGVLQAYVKVIGGGGGGGSNANAGGGGGGGGIAEELVNLVGVTSVAVTVGAGGASATAGGTSSFGAFCSATGGGGATGSAGQNRGDGGTGVGGNINDTLGDGFQRHGNGLGGQISGKGGGAGGGGEREGGTDVGIAGVGFGCGGGGGTGGAAGGGGKAGIVIVRW